MYKKLIVGITSPRSVNLLRGQLKYFVEQGFETYLIAPDDEKTREYCRQEDCILLPVKISREISLLADIASLWAVLKHFYRVKPDIVNIGTPKMGLLGLLAAWLLRVNKRIYTCRGFRYEHEKGFKRKILIAMERITGYCAQDIICISPSVKELGIKDAIFKAEKCHVINKGSSNGINSIKFNADKVLQTEKQELIKKLAISKKFVYGFVGRLIDRKGIAELYTAFNQVYEKDKNSVLLIVGPAEFEQITDKQLVNKLRNHAGIIMPGRTDNVPLYLSVMDVFLLPAWWEGFGNVLVEAAAMGIAVISTNATGTKDAVNDGYNGILVDVKNAGQLANAMSDLKDNKEKRLLMGQNGIEWAKNFNSRIIWEGMEKLYIK
jgi:glycosyltransferase involved in cell wall biosynthesis